MKTLQKTYAELTKAGRWDIDFHLPAEGIRKFSKSILQRIDRVADIAKDKRDPSKEPEVVFRYIDISSVDVSIGVITSPQELEGAEAPSRARKVVQAFDLLISTCRPTRGAIAVVPPSLHNEVASTGFSVVRPHDDVSPLYLHYALRLPSTLEQFRKWSTGSSYPAILDDDVAKTLIPVPDRGEQDRIAEILIAAYRGRQAAVLQADFAWQKALDGILSGLTGEAPSKKEIKSADMELPHTISEIREIIRSLPPLKIDRTGANESQIAFDVLDVA